MRQAMKQEKEIKFPSLTEEELTQDNTRDLITQLDRAIGYNAAIIDILEILKENGGLDKLTYDQHKAILFLRYKS